MSAMAHNLAEPESSFVNLESRHLDDQGMLGRRPERSSLRHECEIASCVRAIVYSSANCAPLGATWIGVYQFAVWTSGQGREHELPKLRWRRLFWERRV